MRVRPEVTPSLSPQIQVTLQKPTASGDHVGLMAWAAPVTKTYLLSAVSLGEVGGPCGFLCVFFPFLFFFFFVVEVLGASASFSFCREKIMSLRPLVDRIWHRSRLDVASAYHPQR